MQKIGLLRLVKALGTIWLRHEPETFDKQLTAILAKVAQEGLIRIEGEISTSRNCPAQSSDVYSC